ncbi:MAG: molybdopterin molybdotransferase MoeA [Acidimicrobiales bacterium]
MIALTEAQELVVAACDPLPPFECDLDSALGRVLSEAVTAAEPVPPFPNSAMDGFAVRAADVAGASEGRPVRLRVVATVAAGKVPDVPVGPGEAIRIMTGAPFPQGADAVAIVETTRADGEGVWICAPAAPGDHVRAPGEDIAAGQEVFPAGTTLAPGHLGVLCSVGREMVSVVRSPLVGVLSTGDELYAGPGALPPGAIRDSNRRTLLGLLRRDGFDALDLGIAPDDEAEIERRLSDGAGRCDAVLTSGGVSMGDFDFVKVVLERIGEMRWLQVAIRPAKPFAFGRVGATPVFGLPGNPVSSMVSYELLARPGLRRLAGHRAGELHRRSVTAVVDGPALRPAGEGRISFTRVQTAPGADGRLHVRSLAGQGSHQLHAMALADALAIVPPGREARDGSIVEVLVLRWP